MESLKELFDDLEIAVDEETYETLQLAIEEWIDKKALERAEAQIPVTDEDTDNAAKKEAVVSDEKEFSDPAEETAVIDAAQDRIDALLQARMDDRMELELYKAKARNPGAVKALLDLTSLSLCEDGQITGLAEQLDMLKKSDSYLFESAVSTGTKHNAARQSPVRQTRSLSDALSEYYNVL